MNNIDQQLIKIALSSEEVTEEVLDEKKKKSKKKPYDSMYIGNGNPAADVKFFNRQANSYLNGTIKAQSASTSDTLAAVAQVGVSPDGGSSVSLSGGDAGASAGGEAGGACCEDLELEEAVVFDPTKIPTQVTLLSQSQVEEFVERLEPEEIFAVGYLNPVYLYKELWEYLPIYKCTEFFGFTGVDFSQTQDTAHLDKEKRIADAKDQIKQAKETGQQVQVGADVVYSSQNKLVKQSEDKAAGIVNNTILFYPMSITNIKYYVKFPNSPNEFVTISADQLEQYIYGNLDKIAKKVFDDPDRAAQWHKKISTYFGKDVIDLDRSTRSNADLGTRFVRKYGLDKIAVRALYTNRIYYLNDGKHSLGKKLAEGLEEEVNLENKYNIAVAIARDKGKPVIYGYRKDKEYHDIEPVVCDDLRACTKEVINKYCPTGSVLVAYPDKSFVEAMELTEFKRYVRRYYIKPQDIFCSNKAEILKALVDHNDEDCIIYTLNNLGDIKDVGKLTDNDVIYYYKDGILYDKNEVRVMDYDLSIKHEEDREKLNPNTVSDAKYKDVYDDRITELTDLEESAPELSDEEAAKIAEESPFDQAFESLREAEVQDKCCICGEDIIGYGNNAEPYASGRCCDACNLKFVIPARIEELKNSKGE